MFLLPIHHFVQESAMQEKVRREVPKDYEQAIDLIYSFFSKRQIQQIKRNPEKITDFHIPYYVEKFWLKEDSPLFGKFNTDGISSRALMSTFILRGVQFKIEGRKMNLSIEIERFKKKDKELTSQIDSAS